MECVEEGRGWVVRRTLRIMGQDDLDGTVSRTPVCIVPIVGPQERGGDVYVCRVRDRECLVES